MNLWKISVLAHKSPCRSFWWCTVFRDGGCRLAFSPQHSCYWVLCLCWVLREFSLFDCSWYLQLPSITNKKRKKKISCSFTISINGNLKLKSWHCICISVCFHYSFRHCCWWILFYFACFCDLDGTYDLAYVLHSGQVLFHQAISPSLGFLSSIMTMSLLQSQVPLSTLKYCLSQPCSLVLCSSCSGSGPFWMNCLCTIALLQTCRHRFVFYF